MLQQFAAVDVRRTTPSQDNTAHTLCKPQIATCRNWAKGECKYSDENCLNAHHLFPVIAERKSSQGNKTQLCKADNACWWPKDVCGYYHTAEQGPPGTARETRRLTQDRGWSAVLLYRCDKCKTTFERVDEVVEHGRTQHKPLPDTLKDSPSGRGDLFGKARNFQPPSNRETSALDTTPRNDSTGVHPAEEDQRHDKMGSDRS